MDLTGEVFSIRNEDEFNTIALKIFRHQFDCNEIYREFIESANISIRGITDYKDIPFMPIEFFRNHDIICGESSGGRTFLSSGTTGSVQSRHNVLDLNIYETSLLRGFELFYDAPSAWHILGLIPSPGENESSSLVYMVNTLINHGAGRQSGFFLHGFPKLEKVLDSLALTTDKVMLIGLSYALLDFSHAYQISFPGLIVMETGGMKGRKRELIREELHHELCEGFGVRKIHSEYGMTELLSQAYSHGDGIFYCPPWMKILIREPNDPFRHVSAGISGGINVIDLANINSCSFIATQDIGRSFDDGSFEVLGRFAYSDTRGCNLMAG